jgi:hypothetical protein
MLRNFNNTDFCSKGNLGSAIGKDGVGRADTFILFRGDQGVGPAHAAMEKS